MCINNSYYTTGLIPKRFFWDLSRYEIRDITPKEQKAHEQTSLDPREGVKSYTRTLWYAIRETKRTAWVNRSGAAPDTPQWRKWLAEAEEAAIQNNKDWTSVARKDVIMKMSESELNNREASISEATRIFDQAEQAAPATQVQPRDRRPADGTL
ncbi:hypothetical protein PC116_g29926 [Phytophthora cactorum]|nr:hypothetical protein PC116_g29926 [Phytophthora cactorum]